MHKSIVIAVLVALSSQGFAQPAKAPARSNDFGPTVDQLRASAIDWSSYSKLPRTSRAGPVTRWEGGYKYFLPDGVEVRFGKCGEDRRCDRAAMMVPVAIRSPEAMKSVEKAIYAHNIMYGDRTRGWQSYFAMLGFEKVGGVEKLILARDFQIESTDTSALINSDYDVFWDMLAAVRKELEASPSSQAR